MTSPGTMVIRELGSTQGIWVEKAKKSGLIKARIPFKKPFFGVFAFEMQDIGGTRPVVIMTADPADVGYGQGISPDEARRLGQALIRAADAADAHVLSSAPLEGTFYGTLSDLREELEKREQEYDLVLERHAARLMARDD